jgi:hypothetical protein
MRYVWIGRNGKVQVFSVREVADLWVLAYGGQLVEEAVVAVV